MRLLAAMLLLLLTGCATAQPKPVRRATLTWHGIEIAYEMPVAGLKK